jgi:hypothetical protein
MTRGLSLSFLLLTACIPEAPEDILKIDNDRDGFNALEDCDDDKASQNLDDADDDGSTTCDGDCDDSNPNIFPGAPELCDGLDNDCNGSISDTETDSDGDGYVGCEVEEGGWTGPNEPQGGGDCDESNAAINPGADEQCDGQNNDCDGETDEDDAIGAQRWRPDLDGDGFGSDGARDSCYRPEHHILEEAGTSFDCNDDDATVYPGAPEICDGQANECGTTDTPEIEFDRDEDNYVQCAEIASSGWVGPGNPGPGDCDETNAAINPAATEICDGVDNNCDGETDEDSATDAATWYADTDGDGYGDASDSTTSCQAPSGHVADGTDCNDANGDVSPGGVEICDSADADEDCNGTADDLDSGATGKTLYYADSDADGYGANSDPGTEYCDPPSGVVLVRDDCNDNAADIHPNANEYCDGVDHDCDGLLNESSSVDAPTWYADTDSDGFGDPSTSLDNCGQPNGYVSNADDCNDTNANIYLGAVEYCNSVDDDCDGTIDENDAQGTLTWYLDADGDNYGLTSNSVQACLRPSGYAPDMGDCDDGLASVSPAATEVCGNGVDDDCNTLVDDNSTNLIWWYRDSDGDGYGLTAEAIRRCPIQSGYSTTGGDCNDAANGVNPGATEICNNNTDDDCDNSTDCDDSDCSSSCPSGGSETTFTLCNDGNDNDGDGYIDCYDCGCSHLSPLCVGFTCLGGGNSGSENTDALCANGGDDDGDGDIDCCDNDCVDTTYCVTGAGTCSIVSTAYEVCTGTGHDEDSANGADCNDPTCNDVFTPSCTSGTTANTVIGGLTTVYEFDGVDCGGMHTCVLGRDSTADDTATTTADTTTIPMCWGDDSKGQSTIPTALSLTEDEEYVGIATGGLHTCVAINNTQTNNSHVVCWGDNAKGQSAAQAYPSTMIYAITAGVAHTCVLLDSGTVRCWGDSTYGATTPPTGNNSSFVSIDAGGYHTCGILDMSFGIKCWGRDDQAQSGSDLNHAFDYVAAGDLHTCGVTNGNRVICWGNDDYHQTTNKPATTAVSHGRISSSGHHTCVEIQNANGNGDSSLECWGWGDAGTGNNQTDTTVTAHPQVTGPYDGFCAGGRHTFFMGSDGNSKLYGFSGDTSSGQNQCSANQTCPFP